MEMENTDIPVPVPSLWFGHGSQSLYTVHEASSDLPQTPRDQTSPVSGRHTAGGRVPRSTQGTLEKGSKPARGTRFLTQKEEMCLDTNPANRVLWIRGGLEHHAPLPSIQEAGEDQEGMQECESSRAHNSQNARTPDRPADLYNPSIATSTTSLPSTAAPQGESNKKQLPQLQHCNLPRRGSSEGSRLVDCSGIRIQWQTYQTPKGRENSRVRCFDNRLGSQLPGSPDRGGGMRSEGSPDAYQLVGAKGSPSSIGNSCGKVDKCACRTAAEQPNHNCLNKLKGIPH